MTPEESAETWKEICFILSKSVSSTMNEKEYEYHVVKAVETLGWKEFKNEIKRQPIINIGHGNKLIPDLIVYNDQDNPLIAIEIKKPTDDLTKDSVYSQLQSYMLQLKAEYGLAIGKTIRFFYDGNLYPQKEPVLLDELKIDEGSEKAQEFVANMNKDSLSNGNHIQYLKNLINKVKAGRDIEKLKKELVSKDTKDKILTYLKNEFIDYGSEIVEIALDSLYLQINHKGTVTRPNAPPIPKPPNTTPGSLTQEVLNFIQSRQKGVCIKEIYNEFEIAPKTAHNIRYRLMKRGLIISDNNGNWIVSHTSPPETSPKNSPTSIPADVNIRKLVLNIIKDHQTGIRNAKIMELTGLKKKQVRNAVYYLKARDKIISTEPGLYKAV